jgi:hypothetical protein
MKVTNWRRKLVASLVAGGLMAPCALEAANLDTNLVTNPGFEDVDVGTICCYHGAATKINSWTNGSLAGFAYNNELEELNGSGNLGWDDGGPLAGGGKYFFGPASGSDDMNYQSVTSPGLVAQNLDVSTGPTGTQIASGQAAVVLSGFFTSYNGQNRHGFMQVDFLNAGGTSLGSTRITSLGEPHPWHQERGAAVVPVGTATLRASLFGDNFNAYIDNVDVRITDATSEFLFAEVNTTTGQVAIKNQSGDPLNIDYYKIESPAGALNATAWNSLQEQNLAGFPAGNGNGNGWEQFGGSSARVIGESYLTGNSSVANSASIGLGAAFNAGGARDLKFFYSALPQSPAPGGDYNGNGTVDAADFVLWRNGGPLLNEIETIGTVTPEDYTAWRANFADTGGFRGPGTLVQGFVKYVTSGTATTVPEPTSVLLVSLGLASVAAGRWPKTKPGGSS